MIARTVTVSEAEAVGSATEVAVSVTGMSAAGAFGGAVYMIGLPLPLVFDERVPQG